MVVLDRSRDFRGRPMADEDGLSAPKDHELLARSHLADVLLDGRERKRIARRVHLIDERPGRRRHANRTRRHGGDMDEVPAMGVFPMGFVSSLSHVVAPRLASAPSRTGGT